MKWERVLHKDISLALHWNMPVGITSLFGQLNDLKTY